MKGKLFRNIVVCIASLTLLAIIAFAATDTINTVPSGTASFLTDLQNFLKKEAANRLSTRTSGIIVSGGTGPTSANLAHTIAACVGFPNGFYVNQASVSHTYSATTRTYVYLRDDDARTVTISGATVTYDGHFVFAEMLIGSARPTLPTGCASLMRVDTSGAAITAAADIRATRIAALNDVSYYGDSHVYFVDPTAVDQGVATNDGNRTVKDFVDSIGASEEATLVFPRGPSGNTTTYTFTTSETIPSNIALKLDRGAILSDGGGSATLTINGSFQPGPWQVFNWTGSGDVVFGRGAVQTCYYAEWWGIDGTDDHTEINKAISAANTAGGGIVQLLGKTYDVTAIVLKGFVTLQGTAKGNTTATGTTLDCKNDTSSVIATEVTGVGFEIGHAKVLDLQIIDGKYGIDLANGAFECEFKNIYIDSTATAGIYLGGDTRFKVANTFENIHPKDCGYAIYGNAGGKLNSNRFVRIRETSCANGTDLTFSGTSKAYSASFHQCDFNTGKVVVHGPAYSFGFYNCYFEGAVTDTGIEVKSTSGVTLVNCYFNAFLKGIVIGVNGESLAVDLISCVFAAGADNQYAVHCDAANAYGVFISNMTALSGGHANYTAVTDPSGTVVRVDSSSNRILVGKYSFHMRAVNPEGAVTAEVGSLFCRSDGNIYRKRTGTGNTGWQIINSYGETAKGADAVGTNVFSATAGALGANAGFLTWQNEAGANIYVPYWTNITP